MEIAIVLVVAAVLVVAFFLLKKKGPSETAAPRELHEAAPARPVAEPTREKAPREKAAPVEAEPVRRAPSARPPAGSPQPPPVAVPAAPIAVEEEYEAPEEKQPSTAQVESLELRSAVDVQSMRRGLAKSRSACDPTVIVCTRVVIVVVVRGQPVSGGQQPGDGGFAGPLATSDP